MQPETEPVCSISGIWFPNPLPHLARANVYPTTAVASYKLPHHHPTCLSTAIWYSEPETERDGSVSGFHPSYPFPALHSQTRCPTAAVASYESPHHHPLPLRCRLIQQTQNWAWRLSFGFLAFLLPCLAFVNATAHGHCRIVRVAPPPPTASLQCQLTQRIRNRATGARFRVYFILLLSEYEWQLPFRSISPSHKTL